MTIGKRIAEKRKENNLTQAALADALNISTAYVSQIEGDIRKPSYKLLIDIAHKLSSTVDYIVSGAGVNVDGQAGPHQTAVAVQVRFFDVAAHAFASAHGAHHFKSGVCGILRR